VVVRDAEGKHLELDALLRAHAAPERLSRVVVAKDEQVALVDVRVAQAGEGALDERAREPAFSVCASDDEMMDPPAAPIVAAEERGDDGPSVEGDEAELRIADEEAFDAVAGVRIAQRDPFGRRPESKRLLVILDPKGANLEGHARRSG